jgi:hypothetical protein
MDSLQPLRNAITMGNTEAILAALPEPPAFLTILFKLEPDDRDTILAGVFPVLDAQEDQWEVIEAAAMNTIAQPERQAFMAVVPYIPAEMLVDARKLVEQFPNRSTADEARRALDTRTAELGKAS